MRHLVFFLLLLFGSTRTATAQVGIGTATPDVRAALDVQSPTYDTGLLIPRLSSGQRRAIASPPQGLLVFQTGSASAAADSVGFWYATGAMSSGGEGRWLYLPVQAAASNGLSVSGGAVRLGGTLGQATTVAQAGHMLALTGGKIGLGTATDQSNSRVNVAASAGENGLYVALPSVYSTENSLKLEHNGSNLTVRPAAAASTTCVVENSAGALALNPNFGNVGLGTTAPSARLDVAGTVRVRTLTLAGTRVVTADADGTLGSVAPTSLADNLGNHTATRDLNLAAYKLTGNGSANGLGIGSNGRLMLDGTNVLLGPAGTGAAVSTGTANVMVGYLVGSGSNASYNTLVGTQSGRQLTTGEQNAFLGLNSGAATTTGTANVFVGNGAGETNTSGGYNTALGYGADVGAGLTNATAIGANARVSQSGSLVLGGTGADAVKVGIGTTAPTAVLDVAGTFKLGSQGPVLAAVLKAAVAKNLPSIAAGSSSTETFAVPNAEPGGSVTISPGNALNDGLIIQYARVSAAGTVQAKFYNRSAAAINEAAMDFYITVIQ